MTLLVAMLLAQSTSLGPPTRVNIVQPTDGGRPVSVSVTNTVTVRQGTSPWLVAGADAGAVQTAAAYPFPVSDPMQSAALTGLWNGRVAMPVYVLGKRVGFSGTTVLEDCVAYLGTTQARYNEGSASEALWLYSSSDSDNNDGGSGIRTMRVVAVMADGGQEARTYSMEGTNSVFMDAGFASIQWMEAASVGSNTVAVGNVTVGTVSGAPSVAQTRELVSSGGNRSLSGRYRVPAGYSAYMKSWNFTNVSTVANTTQDARIRMTSFSDDSTLSTGAYHFVDTAYLGSNGNYVADLPWVKVPANADIKVSTISSNAGTGTRVDCSFHLLLVKD